MEGRDIFGGILLKMSLTLACLSNLLSISVKLKTV